MLHLRQRRDATPATTRWRNTFEENLEQWPHLNELVHCYTTDWVKDENKYGHYDTVGTPSFHNQIYEGPDTDIETEMRLAGARLTKGDDISEDDIPSTSGRQFTEGADGDLLHSDVPKHIGQSPLPAYEPAFDWENERALIFGQRIPETPLSHGMKISVKVQSLQFQAGLVEPFYGTICLYNRERREKLSEDFYFHVLPTETQDAKITCEPRAVFYLDAPSASVCLLIQLEKHATEEGGVTASVYSRKDSVHLTEREKQKLQVWSKIMPYKESFAWTIVSLFDSSIGAASVGPASPSSPLAPSVSGSSSHEGVFETSAKISLDGKLSYSNGNSVVVEVSNLNKVKESYTEESLQDPKRKVHKPVKGVLRLEIEKHQISQADLENMSESGSITNDSADPGDRIADSLSGKYPSNGCDDPQGSIQRVVSPVSGNGANQHGNSDFNADDFHAFDFRTTTRNEPFLQLFHCLYVYPLTVSLGRKKNLFIRVELREDDGDIRRQPLEAIYPRDPGLDASFQKWGHTQVAVGARVACYHDEIKLSLPAMWTPMHHLLFTLFHVDLQTKLEAPKPVVIGYAALPLSSHAQLRSEINIPIMRELVPHYLQDAGRERLDYLEDGKSVFRLRLRLCSSLYPINERIRDFFLEYDRHTLRTSPPWGSELLEAINSLKNVDSTALLQFLHPILNMLLHLIGNGGETLQVAAFRAMVNIVTRVQQESVDDAERNHFLVNYVDCAFDDFGGRQPPVYPGLSTVWGSLARSKAKGYRVGPVYDDVLAMAWFFLELIVKSMALEKTRLFYHSLPIGEDIPPMQLKDGVFRCIMQLYDCLLTEVHERCKKGLSLAKRLNSSLAFFCYDLLSIIEPRQIFELVSLYLDKFSGVCQSVLHECKLTFLQIICDHDLFVEMPGRDPSDRNYLSSVLIQELFLTWDHEDLSLRAKAARILVVLLCKHEFDVRYQKPEDKLYIAQLYFPLVGQILDEMPVFYNLNPVEKREVSIVILQIVRNLDDASLVKAWQQSIARTRLFFKLMEECLLLFEHKKPADGMLLGSSSRNPVGEAPTSPKYSDRLSPAINNYLSEASRQEVRPQGTPDNGYLWQRVNSQLSSPSQPYSLREALAQAQSSRIGASAQALRESLHPLLRQKLELWEENLSASVSLQVLEVTEKFSMVAASHSIATDFGKLDCITAVFMSFLSRNQPLTFWKAFFPVFNSVFDLHGATLMARENDRFLKQVTFHLLRLAVFRNENVRKRAVVGLQILVRSSFHHFMQTARLRVMLIITLSELMSDVQVTQMRSDGSLEESGEARRLRKSLDEMKAETKNAYMLKECGLPENALVTVPEKVTENRWSWSEVKYLSDSLLLALDASLEHALLVAAVVFTEDLKRLYVTMKEGFPLEFVVDIPLDPYLFEIITSSGVEVDLLQKRQIHYFMKVVIALVPGVLILWLIRESVMLLHITSKRFLYKKYNQLFDMAHAENFIMPVGDVGETKSMYKEVVLGGDVWDLLDELMIYMGNPMQFYERDVQFVRGILLSGPPGTGKTLFARTLAKESGLPFVFASGAEFTDSEKSGAARINEMFSIARRNAPCFVFVDEIDAIAGRHARKDPRRRATFEALIAQLDGEKEKTGVDRLSLRQAIIFICATNRPDELDLEFVRPGRIDRRLYIGLPDAKQRVQIFGVHSSGRQLAEDVNFEELVFRTVGFSGADIRNLVNEAAIMSVRKGHSKIFQQDIIDVLDKQLLEGMGVLLTEEEQQKCEQRVSFEKKRLLAVHEAGHIVLAHLFPRFDWHAFSQLLPGGKETAISVFYPREDMVDQGYTTFGYMMMQMVVAHGGQCAERIVFGDDITDGGRDDLEKITKIAREMVISPQNKKLGLIALTKRVGLVDRPDSPDGELIRYRWDDPQVIPANMTLEVSELFTRELTRYIEETEELAMNALRNNRHILDLITSELLERSRITGLEVEEKLKELSPVMFEDFVKPFQINPDEEGPLRHNDRLRYQLPDLYPAPLHRC